MNLSEIVISEEDDSRNSCSSLRNINVLFDRNELPNPLRCFYPSIHHSDGYQSKEPSPIKNPEHVMSSNLSRKRGRGSDYSHLELKSLLDVIGSTRPRSDKEWDAVRRLHSLYSNQERSTRSLKKKFHQIKTNMEDPSHAASSHSIQPADSHLLLRSLVSSQLLTGFARQRSAERLVSTSFTLHRVPRMYSLAVSPVPNPLSTITYSEQIPRDVVSEVPNVISIPASPESGIIDTTEDDDISELGLDDKPKDDEDNADF
jgi:hypothetical protein